jgi:hypothetical protein
MLGSEFNATYPRHHFVKFTNGSGVHRDVSYREGLITLKQAFIIDGECSPGGLYFTWIGNEEWAKKYSQDIGDISYVYDVVIPDDALVVMYSTKAKTNKFVLKHKRPISLLNAHGREQAENYMDICYPNEPELKREVLLLHGLIKRPVSLKDLVAFVEGTPIFEVYKGLYGRRSGKFYNPDLSNLPKKYLNKWAVDHFLKYCSDTQHDFSLIKPIVKDNLEFFQERASMYKANAVRRLW